jgi:AraC family transcriptional regulator
MSLQSSYAESTRVYHADVEAVFSDDPIIRSLSDALATMEVAQDRHSRACADALRLAIANRNLSRQAAPAMAPAGTAEGACDRKAKSLQKWRLKRVLEYVDANLAEKITLQDMATVAGLSRMHFAAQFRAATGSRPHEHILKRRIERAEELLKQTRESLVEIALTVGFQTQAHFTTVFKRFTGDTPYQWRSEHLAQPMARQLAEARV